MLQERYGFAFSPMFAADTKGVFDALQSGRAPFILTDVQDVVKENDLIALEDDRGFFPLYRPVPAVKSGTLQSYAEIAPAIGMLEGHLDAETMARLIHEVEVEDVRVKTVAETFLLDKGLLQHEPGTLGHKPIGREPVERIP